MDERMSGERKNAATAGEARWHDTKELTWQLPYWYKEATVSLVCACRNPCPSDATTELESISWEGWKWLVRMWGSYLYVVQRARLSALLPSRLVGSYLASCQLQEEEHLSDDSSAAEFATRRMTMLSTALIRLETQHTREHLPAVTPTPTSPPLFLLF